jgi:Tol biopolymer transport system component
MDNSVCVTDVNSRKTTRVTVRSDDASAPRSEACVFSSDGRKIAFLRRLNEAGQSANQIFIVSLAK